MLKAKLYGNGLNWSHCHSLKTPRSSSFGSVPLCKKYYIQGCLFKWGGGGYCACRASSMTWIVSARQAFNFSSGRTARPWPSRRPVGIIGAAKYSLWATIDWLGWEGSQPPCSPQLNVCASPVWRSGSSSGRSMDGYWSGCCSQRLLLLCVRWWWLWAAAGAPSPGRAAPLWAALCRCRTTLIARPAAHTGTPGVRATTMPAQTYPTLVLPTLVLPSKHRGRLNKTWPHSLHN